MLAFVEEFRCDDAAARFADVLEDKVLEVRDERCKEAICISKIIAGVGLMKCNGRTYVTAYVVPRKIDVPDDDAADAN